MSEDLSAQAAVSITDEAYITLKIAYEDLFRRFEIIQEQALKIAKDRDRYKDMVEGNLRIAEFMKAQAEQLIRDIKPKED